MDPGVRGSLLSPHILWNLFLGGLILSFVVSIVEQVAMQEHASQQAANGGGAHGGGGSGATPRRGKAKSA